MYHSYSIKIQNHHVELSRIFSSIRSAGGYSFGGYAKFPCLPGLRVNGVGEISFPICAAQAEKIKTVGSQAPYGKGAETIVDIKVRDSVQVEPSQVTISNPHWLSGLQQLVREASLGLGIDEENIRAEFYKLLLYETGGHFKAHTDSEKFPGMFGTLVVQFPSAFSGGAYTVRHQGEERVFLMGTDDSTCSSSHHYVAHYADCEHEVAEITAGHRLVAVFALIWTKAGLPHPTVLANANAEHQLAQYLKEHLGDRTLGALLTHGYTHQSLGNLGLMALKHHDRAIAGTLLAASALLKAGRTGDELVLHIAKANRLAIDDEEEDLDPEPMIGMYVTEINEYLMQAYTADGRLRTYETAGLGRFKIFEDIVNLDVKEEDRRSPLREASFSERAGWHYDREVGYTGNQGTADAYKRYVLTFCRRDVADGWPKSKV